MKRGDEKMPPFHKDASFSSLWWKGFKVPSVVPAEHWQPVICLEGHTAAWWSLVLLKEALQQCCPARQAFNPLQLLQQRTQRRQRWYPLQCTPWTPVLQRQSVCYSLLSVGYNSPEDACEVCVAVSPDQDLHIRALLFGQRGTPLFCFDRAWEGTSQRCPAMSLAGVHLQVQCEKS